LGGYFRPILGHILVRHATSTPPFPFLSPHLCSSPTYNPTFQSLRIYFIYFYIQEDNKGMGYSANIHSQLPFYYTNKNVKDGCYELMIDWMMEDEEV